MHVHIHFLDDETRAGVPRWQSVAHDLLSASGVERIVPPIFPSFSLPYSVHLPSRLPAAIIAFVPLAIRACCILGEVRESLPF